MKKMTTGEIYKIFKTYDKNTIIRKTNMRYHCRANELDYIITQDKWMIDCDSFMQSINQKRILRTIRMPRLRTKISAQNEWNTTHRKKIKHHIIDKICDSGKVFVYKHGRTNIINYDELEKELIKVLKDRNEY